MNWALVVVANTKAKKRIAGESVLRRNGILMSAFVFHPGPIGRFRAEEGNIPHHSGRVWPQGGEGRSWRDGPQYPMRGNSRVGWAPGRSIGRSAAARASRA